ncbi:hypothetical protein ACNKHL_03235 [Shigella flexneri]
MQRQQASGISFACYRIMDSSAWANTPIQAIIITFQDLMDCFSGMGNRIRGIFSSGGIFPAMRQEEVTLSISLMRKSSF